MIQKLINDNFPVDDNILYIQVNSDEYLEKIEFPKDDEYFIPSTLASFIRTSSNKYLDFAEVASNLYISASLAFLDTHSEEYFSNAVTLFNKIT